MAKRIRIHYHRPGKGTIVYHEDLVLDRQDVKVTLLAAYDGKAVTANGAVILGPGAPIVWYVFPDEWYDIGRFHLSDGTFTGWYTNLCVPTEIAGEDWHCSDLFLDHWLGAEGDASWLDEDEFQQAVNGGLLDAPTAERVVAQRASVDRKMAAGAWPPAITREIDLATARRTVAA